jgi:hypothetical protein
MPRQYDYNGLGNSIGNSSRMIADHVMRLPAIRHQLQQEAMTAAERNAMNQARIETERTQQENYRASTRKGNAEAALTEDEFQAAKELQAAFDEPGALTSTPAGGITLSPSAAQKTLSLLTRAGTRASAFGSGARNILSAQNAPFEAEANRMATGERNAATIAGAGERNTYSVDQREQTQRTAPVELNTGAQLVNPITGQLINAGIHKLSPDQTLLGDVPGVTLDRVGQGIPKPTTPRAQAIRDQLAAAMLKEGDAGTNVQARLAEFDQLTSGGGAPVKPTPAPQNKAMTPEIAKEFLLKHKGNRAAAEAEAKTLGYSW